MKANLKVCPKINPQACLKVFFKFMEDFVYKCKFDGPIRNGLRHNSSVFDILQHADIKDRWEEVLKGAGEASRSDGRDDETMKNKDSDGLEESAFPQMDAGFLLF